MTHTIPEPPPLPVDDWSDTTAPEPGMHSACVRDTVCVLGWSIPILSVLRGTSELPDLQFVDRGAAAAAIDTVATRRLWCYDDINRMIFVRGSLSPAHDDVALLHAIAEAYCSLCNLRPFDGFISALVQFAMEARRRGEHINHDHSSQGA